MKSPTLETDYQCPVCDTPKSEGWCKQKTVLADKSTDYAVSVRIKCSACGYWFRAREFFVKEKIGPITIQHTIGLDADMPGFPNLVKTIEMAQDLRRKVLKEVRKLWSCKEARLIMECLTEPNANKKALKRKLSEWVARRASLFPICYTYCKPNDENDKDNRRGEGETNPHRDDNQPDDIRGDGGPVG